MNKPKYKTLTLIWNPITGKYTVVDKKNAIIVGEVDEKDILYKLKFDN